MTAILLLCVSAVVALAQQPGARPTFRTGTQLVQVNVVATDKNDKPVGDLRREEFQIFDNGAPQEIRVFLAEKPAPLLAAPEAVNTPGTFTNQVLLPDGVRSGYSVILFDNLVTGFGKPDEDGTSAGTQRVLRTLHNLPQGEKVALYATGRKLQIVREFTSDRASLEASLRAWKPSIDDAEIGEALCPNASDVSATVASAAPEVAAGLERAGLECIRIDMAPRLESFDQELAAIADHLAAVPGRKNLIWLANRFPIAGGAGVQRLANAGVAIYPVDEAGVCRVCPPRPTQQMIALANLTGGVATFGRNDLDVAVQEAMDDGRISYTLGFYQPDAPNPKDKRPALHQLTVRVDRPGLTLRYRASYQPVPPPAPSASPVGDLVQAMRQPMDSSLIPLTATVKRSADRLDLAASIGIASLGLNLASGVWKGEAEVVARFMSADGKWVGETVSDTVKLNLRPATYQSMLKAGLPYRKQLKLPAKAVELKLTVGVLSTGKVGTLTVPLSQIEGSAPDAK